ncbi:hypothetical protein GUG39_22155 [Xanthomonas citri pv. citri]|nr:hypothetical protein [Xanthomonas citri pv. citri]
MPDEYEQQGIDAAQQHMEQQAAREAQEAEAAESGASWFEQLRQQNAELVAAQEQEREQEQEQGGMER